MTTAQLIAEAAYAEAHATPTALDGHSSFRARAPRASLQVRLDEPRPLADNGS